jgi:hypothetical protein
MKMLCVTIGLASMLAGCTIVHAMSSQTGHLFVALTDRETGGPITNATVTVRCQTEFNIGYTIEDHFTKTTAPTGPDGVAHVVFQFYDPEFTWWVDAPSHHNGRFGTGRGDEKFSRRVVESDYCNIDTNTVAGLAMYNELKSLYDAGDVMGFLSKFNPKSVIYTSNVVHRAVCLTPRHNAQPMYAYGHPDRIYLPMKNNRTTIVTNGLEITRYKPVDFDMKECLKVISEPDYDYYLHGPSGDVSDFHIERFSVTTNGVHTRYGWIEFAPGCGAYKRNITDDPSFPTTYEADTNETFLTRIPFEYSSVSGQVVYAKNVLEGHEYMVLKTRVTTNEVGEVTSCNYSKILGPLRTWDRLYFRSLIFNPRPNDPNLEFDTDNNLATSDPCNWYP